MVKCNGVSQEGKTSRAQRAFAVRGKSGKRCPSYKKIFVWCLGLMMHKVGSSSVLRL